MLDNDPHRREIIWGLIKGKSKKTIVLFHHHDAVGIEDFGKLINVALRPDALAEALKERHLSSTVRMDLESEEWLFARGAADMKSGASIQMGLMDQFSQDKSFQDKLFLISLPDEENLSKGMLAATELMSEISGIHNLDYKLIINSEPYFNQSKKKAILYEGSAQTNRTGIYKECLREDSRDSKPFNIGSLPGFKGLIYECKRRL
jgi:arginine utilization protein RocB